MAEVSPRMSKEAVKKCLEELELLVFEEKRPVSYRWLSFHKKIPVGDSKKVLEQFVSNQKQDAISVVHMLSGKLLGDGQKQIVKLVLGNQLEGEKEKLKEVIGTHVYSVQLKIEETSAGKSVSKSSKMEAESEKPKSSASSKNAKKELTPVIKLGQKLAELDFEQVFKLYDEDNVMEPNALRDARYSSISNKNVSRSQHRTPFAQPKERLPEPVHNKRKSSSKTSEKQAAKKKDKKKSFFGKSKSEPVSESKEEKPELKKSQSLVKSPRKRGGGGIKALFAKQPKKGKSKKRKQKSSSSNSSLSSSSSTTEQSKYFSSDAKEEIHQNYEAILSDGGNVTKRLTKSPNVKKKARKGKISALKGNTKEKAEFTPLPSKFKLYDTESSDDSDNPLDAGFDSASDDEDFQDQIRKPQRKKQKTSKKKKVKKSVVEESSSEEDNDSDDESIEDEKRREARANFFGKHAEGTVKIPTPKKRKRVTKSYINDHGYLVTEDVYESVDEDEADKKTEKPEKQEKPKQKPKKQPPKKKQKTSPKKKKVQAGLTMFFKKK